jgi:hypothetical protein
MAISGIGTQRDGGRRYGTIGSLATAALLAAADIAAQPPSGLTGIWMQDRGSWVIEALPFTPAGAEQHASKRAPSAVEACTIQHFGQIITGPLPVEILEGEGRITFLYENNHEVRRIFLDGRGHPTNLYPTVMGHSIGWWDGATLVVETVGLRAGWFRPEGVPYSEAARVTERHTLTAGGQTLHVELRLEDSVYYTRPVDVSRTFTLMPGGEILEDLCVVSEYLYE